MSQQTPLGGLVQKTPFEALVDKIKANNEVRDRHISCLERIMTAYSYVMCVLEASLHRITINDIDNVNNFIDEILEEKNKKVKLAANNNDKTYYLEQRENDTSIWVSVYYSRQNSRYQPNDILLFKSSHWDWWRKQSQESEKPITLYRLQEELCDTEKLLFRYDKLPDFVKNYPWAFPPNVAELHKELIEREESQAP